MRNYKNRNRLGRALRSNLLTVSALFLCAGFRVQADGGTGGSTNLTVPGGAGGTGYNGQTGGNGQNNPPNDGTGGGGGGAGGGAGGNGADGGGGGGAGGLGGAGGTSISPNGQDAPVAPVNGNPGSTAGGGGGGGGGYNGNGSGALTIINNSGTLQGGNGGAGADGGISTYINPIGGGGGGGAGGYGAIVTGSGANSNGGSIIGGNGGSGGNGGGGADFGSAGGNGGDGGIGILFSVTGATLINLGTISGGNGGAAGISDPSSPGLGGVGISGGGLAITNSGTISGGVDGVGNQANAINFTSGVNTLTLLPGSTITGNVIAFSTADSLILGGNTNAAFDVSQIGASSQYQGFGVFQKVGTGTWTLTNTTTAVTPWTVLAGTLAISQDGSLGDPSGAVTLNGGTLRTTSAFSSSRNITLLAGGGTLQTDADLTLTGTISNVGSLTKTGTGTLFTSAANTYSGGTTISAGGLELGDGSTPGASLGTGAVTANGTGIFTLNLANNETFSNRIFDNNQVVLDDNVSSNYTVAGMITGTGSVMKTGANTITITGNNNYSGGTTVSAGTLVVGNMNALGTGLLQVNGGTLTVGNGNHVISVDSYAQTGGSLLLNLTGNGRAATADLLRIANTLSSQASLGGNITVDLGSFNAPALYGRTTTYLFPLIATGAGFNGTFGSYNVLNLGNGLTAGFNYGIEPDDVFLQVNQAASSINGLALTGLTPNQQAILGPINIGIGAGNISPGFVTLVNGILPSSNSPAAFGAALNELSPQAFGQFTSVTAFNNASFATEAKDQYAASQRGGPNGTFMGGNGSIDTSGLTLNDPSYDPILAMVHSRLLAWNPAPAGAISDTANPLLGGVEMKDTKAMAAPAVGDPWNFFVRGNVILAQGFSDPDVSHFNDNTESVGLGADYRITPNFLIGICAGYAHTDVTLDNNGSSATADSYSPGIYASYANKGWYANVSGDYVHNAYSQSRVIGFLGQTATSAPEGNEGVANLDGGYDFHRGAWTFGPLAGLQYTHLTVDGYTESGSIADLSVNDQNADSLRSRLGGRTSLSLSHFGVSFTPHLDATWQHEFMDQSRGITSQFSGAGLGSFSVKTDNPSRDSALVDAGLDAQVDETVTVFVDYAVQAGQSNYFGQSVQAGFKIGF